MATQFDAHLDPPADDSCCDCCGNDDRHCECSSHTCRACGDFVGADERLCGICRAEDAAGEAADAWLDERVAS